MDAKRVGFAIKTLRIKLGYTQHQLADCLSVTDKAVSKWERGLSVSDISIVPLLSDILNADIVNFGLAATLARENSHGQTEF